MTLLTKLIFIGFSLFTLACQAQTNRTSSVSTIQTGADQMNLYLSALQGKRVGMVVNHTLPVAPTPNLPNQRAVLLYPSLCFFEGTVVSVGRGTDKQFQVIGSPYTQYGPYRFTPVDKTGAVNPPSEGQLCYGLNLSKASISKQGLMLTYFFDFFNRASDKNKFFLANNGIDRLAGTDQLRLQLLAGVSEAKIRESWQPALDGYKLMRKKYLLYP